MASDTENLHNRQAIADEIGVYGFFIPLALVFDSFVLLDWLVYDGISLSIATYANEIRSSQF
jgi:hypothetical protein